jgi:hypothetical protein
MIFQCNVLIVLPDGWPLILVAKRRFSIGIRIAIIADAPALIRKSFGCARESLDTRECCSLINSTGISLAIATFNTMND